MEQQLQSKVNFYELLGIDRQATHLEVKRAYRSLVKQYHPDVSNKPDTAKSFQLIQKAYEVLSDPQKREIYDKLLYRKEHGIGNENPHQYFRTRARYNAYYQTATATEKAPETRSEQLQFHLKQFVGLVIVTALFLVGLGLMGLAVFFLFIKEFNGSMIAGYATLAGGTAILMNSLKAYRDIGNIWLNWFQKKE
jgi:curved DNA-binding protein CbpA